MDEYIERKAAIRALLNDAPEQVSYSHEDAADCIRYIDAADVAPVRHGHWIDKGGVWSLHGMRWTEWYTIRRRRADTFDDAILS